MTTYGSLFSGAGGFEIGLNKLGWKCKWLCEQDKYAKSVLQYHFPQIPLHSNILDLSHPEPVDIIVGGFPCQTFSIAGKKTGDGLELFYEFVRIVKEMREETNGEYPKAVIWENVPGLLSKTKPWINNIYNAWAEIGALVQEHRIIDAQYFGVPQRRRRVVGTVIFDTGTGCRPSILFDEESSEWDSGKSKQKGKNSSADASPSVNEHSESDKYITPTLTASFSKGIGNTQVECGYVIPFDTTQLTHPANGSNPQPGDPVSTFSSQAHPPKIAYNVTPVSGQGKYLAATEVTTAASLTAIESERGIKIIEPEHWLARKLTEIELERLMSWPDNWTALGENTLGEIKPISMSQRRKMCGNGIVSNCAQWAGNRLEQYLSENKVKD